MTREQHLQFCKVCKNQKFDVKRGIICGLTNEIANFEGECADFSSDVKVDSNPVEDELKDNSQRGKSVIVLFWVMLFTAFGWLVVNLYEYFVVEELYSNIYNDDSGTMYFAIKGLIFLLNVLVRITTIVLFLVWFTRAYKNLHRLKIKHLEFSPAWASWSFFIPIINLFQPYKIAKEIIEETTKKIKKLNPFEPIPKSFPIVGWWWTFYILMLISYSVSNALGDVDMFNYAGIKRYTLALTVGNVFNLIAAIMALLMIRKISRYESIMMEYSKSTDEESKLV